MGLSADYFFLINRQITGKYISGVSVNALENLVHPMVRNILFISSFFSQLGVRTVYHGDTLPDIQDDYIIEKYIDDKYPRVSVDGYLIGDKIEILSVVDSVYYEDDPLKFNYLASHSIHDSAALREKYFETIKEIKEVTNCDNQIIDVEFFITGEKAIGMEINPRIFSNMVPVYSQMTGYNPWLAMEAIKNGQTPMKTTTTCKNVICKYNHIFNHNDAFIQHDTSFFTVISSFHSHTYGFSNELSREHLLGLINQYSIQQYSD